MASNETIAFVPGYEPPISPGVYTLTVKQELQIPAKSIHETYFNTKKVVVQGERFRIDPLAIDSVFPPDQSKGTYSCVLPHILFSRKTLLWERKSGVPEAPWLALLVFHANDPGGVPPIKPATIGDLSPSSFVFVGDSITEHWKRYINPANYPITFHVVPGYRTRTDEILSRNELYKKAIEAKPTCIQVIAGGSDLVQGKAPASIRANIQNMIEKARAAGIRLYLGLTPCGRNQSDGAHSQEAKDLSVWLKTQQQPGVHYIDYFEALVGNDGLYYAAANTDDGVLPNATGYSIMTKRFLEPRDSILKPSTATYMDAQKSWALDYGEEVSDPCMVVDVPVNLFQDIAPAQQDLRWLAHCRIVNDPARMKSREFSVLFANRLPQAKGVSAVYVVSLEGLAPFLRTASPAEPAIMVNKAKAAHVRLVVLKAWSFNSQPDTSHGVNNLKNGYEPLRLTYEEPSPALTEKLDIDAGNEVKNALLMGYTAMDHTTRFGDRTVSWYRGPLLPFKSVVPLVVVPLPIDRDGYTKDHAPICTADQALRYVRNLGMLDVSYSAAWQLGRLMALRDTTFSFALFHWKREVRQKTHAAAEGLALRLQSIVGLFADVLAGNETGENESRPRHANAEWRRIVNSIEKMVKLHSQTEAPEVVVNWLARLRHLDGVPLDYLVSDERMLPAESLRYFQVDPNWIYSLIEGAFSVARDTSSDLAHDSALGRCVHYPDRGGSGYPQMSGFLLRSAAVSDCPGLQVKVQVQNSVKPPLQFKRLAPDILFCLVEGIIEKVTFPEPPESINFGLEYNGTTKTLRKADGTPADRSVTVSETSAHCRILKIDSLAYEIKTSLDGQFPNFNAADFALEMLRS